MWEQVKREMAESAREVCVSVRVGGGGKNPKSVRGSDEVKAAVRRKEVLAASDGEAEERCMEVYREEKRKVKMCIYQSKKKVNEQFGRKMNEDVNGSRILFWKEVSNAKGGKVKSCSRIKDGNGRLSQWEDKMRKIWKEYFEDLYNIDTQEQVPVHMCGFNGIWRSNYFGGEPIGRAEG